MRAIEQADISIYIRNKKPPSEIAQRKGGASIRSRKAKKPWMCIRAHELSDHYTKGNVKGGRVSSTAPLEGSFPGASLGVLSSREASPRWWRQMRANRLDRARINTVPSWTTPTLAPMSFLGSLLFSVECFHTLKLPWDIAKDKLTPSY